MTGGTGRMQLARSRRQLIALAACGLISTLTALALPAALGRAIDGGGIAVPAALAAISISCDLYDSYTAPAYAASATARLRHRLIGQILAVSPHRLLPFATGDLVSRISGQAAQAAQAGLSRITLILGLISPIGSLILLSVMDLRLGAAFLAGTGFVALVLRSFSRRTTEISASYQRVQGEIAARLTEALGGARTIAAAGTMDAERRRILYPLAELSEHGTKTWRVLARSTAQGAVTAPLLLIAVLTTGGLLLSRGAITAGDLFAAARYAVIGAGLGSLTGVLGGLARAKAGTARIEEVTAIAPVAYGRRPLPDGPGTLDFAGVSVEGVLHDVTFTIPAGACAAVVGRSGGGKSVLAELAARLRDPDRGAVLLDGVPLAEVSQDAVRRAIGCAFERPVLLGGTVADAIGCGRDHALVASAAAAAQAHDFVVRLPHGYATPLADTPMSGGEAQRLGLARAWYADRLLVLDDAMSSVDMVTEMRISEALLAAGRTRMIATHRVTTAARADLVVWLADGRVRAVGPHEQLWADPDYRAVFA